MNGADDIEISLWEVAGFTFDMTCPTDRELLQLALEALADLDEGL